MGIHTLFHRHSYGPSPQPGRVECIVDLRACTGSLQHHHVDSDSLQLCLYTPAEFLQHLDRSSFPTWCRSPLHSLVQLVQQLLVVQVLPQFLEVHLLDQLGSPGGPGGTWLPGIPSRPSLPCWPSRPSRPWSNSKLGQLKRLLVLLTELLSSLFSSANPTLAIKWSTQYLWYSINLYVSHLVPRSLATIAELLTKQISSLVL